jgi:hypothetical protein
MIRDNVAAYFTSIMDVSTTLFTSISSMICLLCLCISYSLVGIRVIHHTFYKPYHEPLGCSINISILFLIDIGH